MVNNKMGKVYIIGAGCGNIDLLTLKGKRCIEEADCVVYDRLIDPKVLKLAKENAEMIYLGKGNTEGGVIQDEINKTLAKKALEGKVVARVKGGDPFVFGRGGEEIEEIVKYSIPFEIIPGISSSIAVPEYAGIPVTHRGLARSFHVFTGHTMENGEWHDFSTIAKLDGTLVFLMGIKNLDLITGDLIKNGKNPKTPVAVIEKGTSENQRVTVGTLEDIVERAKSEKIVPPAITIIGDVVNMRETFKWFENQPLSGKKVLVTRDTNQSQEFSEKLRIKGATVRELPFIKIENAYDFNEKDLKNYSALLFNSPNGVKYFMENIKDIRSLGHLKIGVVGAKTDELLREYKIIPDFIPEKYMGIELAKEVQNYTKENDKVLFVTSDISPANCEKWSEEYNRKFEKLVVYKTGKHIYSKDEVETVLNEIEYITFLSSSTVEAFNESIQGDLKLLEDKKIVSIGPVTTKTLNELGYNVALEAKVFDVDGVIAVIGEK
ncbi:MAG: uroporphyrinogen-III C-methyltransferase [Cetobacterium sp.]|uniref:uroporphyrinogen-III C-methyltransferase n=1 Tax=Cetobacterium TaxID=180162 RepID=UPI001F05B564|nr:MULTISPECIES: uroporphyrinogen-III C-methyltransferase [Cetobacterium]MCX3067439.1 uroporphyrinogen-III C-methyltransferase [Cetobacterium somerae]UPO97662.1 uroporphyrinogen-III C-methyltransferase [Cetobacterium somerae]WVJ00474.1 uroporphyrinogen-III C-methyltransferase [Cetobacterium somerae]